MSEELITVQGTVRTLTGKNANRKLRATGKIPANILSEAKSTLIDLDPKWLSKIWKSGKVFNLEINNQVKKVTIHELQISPVKRAALHVDLMYV